MNVRYVVSDAAVVQEISSKDAKGVISWREHASKQPAEVCKLLMPPNDLGLLPPGLRLFQQAGDITQVAMECPPSIARLSYNRYDPKTGYGNQSIKGHALVATPWRVILARYRGAHMIGARMFYRPSPLVPGDTVLYHTNLPNINCVGYGGTAVGWVCFYAEQPKHTWPERLFRLIERCSGTEGYNNNMTGTDGPQFYQTHGGKEWQYSVSEWEKETNKHKGDLTFVLQDEKGECPWLPVKVTNNKAQLSHSEAKTAKPLTLELALSGKAPFYYDDDGIFPTGKEDVTPKALFNSVHQAFANATN